MKHELREGSYEIKPRSTMHLIRELYAIGPNERYCISLECKSEDYEDDNFVQNLRSRSLNHNNIIEDIPERSNVRLKYYKSLDYKNRKRKSSIRIKSTRQF